MRKACPPASHLYLLTRREGLLSAIGHDLRLTVHAFEVTLDEGKGEASGWFDLSSIEVVCAVRGGADLPDALTAGDRSRIDAHIKRDVFDLARSPRATFSLTQLGKDTARGLLTLNGVSAELGLTWGSDARGFIRVAGVVDQRRFGLKPFRALGGALAVKPEVELQLRLAPAPP